MTGLAALTMTSDRQSFWESAYEEHGPSVLAFLRSRANSVDDAEELLQETFVRAIRADGLRDRTRARSYLFTIAHNLLHNRRRHDLRSPLVAIKAVDDVEGGETADSRLRMRRLAQRLDEVLQAMSRAHRQAFELAVLDKVPYRDIAQMKGWSLAQVKINVFRARKQIVGGLADLVADAGGGRK